MVEHGAYLQTMWMPSTFSPPHPSPPIRLPAPTHQQILLHQPLQQPSRRPIRQCVSQDLVSMALLLRISMVLMKLVGWQYKQMARLWWLGILPELPGISRLCAITSMALSIRLLMEMEKSLSILTIIATLPLEWLFNPMERSSWLAQPGIALAPISL